MLAEIILLLVLVAVDQLSKWQVLLHLAPLGSSVDLIPGVFELTFVKNTGAAFGIFKDGTLVLSIVVVLILALVLYFKRKLPNTRHYLPLHILAIFIMAGAIGNLIDRIRLRYVVDMFHFYWFEFPVFNVADVYVSVSAFVLMILLLTKYKDMEL